MTEDQLEQEVMGWLAEVGYRTVCGYDVAPDSDNPWRSDFRQVVLEDVLREAVQRLNPKVPAQAREDAVRQVLNLDTPAQLLANRLFHRLLVNGVKEIGSAHV